MTARKTPAKQVPRSAPVRVEIRVAGRIRFADDVYEPQVDITDDTVSWSADRKPTMVDELPPARPPTRFIDQDDPRDGEEIIQKVHSGRRDLPPEPKESDDD
jgi:hypothetical protein